MLHEVTVHHTVCTTASTVSPTCVLKSQIPWFQQMWKSYIVQKAYCMYLIIKDIKERMTYRFFIHLFHLTLCSPLLRKPSKFSRSTKTSRKLPSKNGLNYSSNSQQESSENGFSKNHSIYVSKHKKAMMKNLQPPGFDRE